MQSRSEISAGGVVYERKDDDVRVALAARRTRKGELVWGLPKGGIDEGESEVDAAIREVREETGLEAVVEEDLGQIRYMYVWEGVRVRKSVRFFLMQATGGDVSRHDDEMEDVRWFSLPSAIRRAAYRGEREVLKRARDRFA
jgi:8-oxo-dGTP pyrophosphatase MutT (NUDIX family)